MKFLRSTLLLLSVCGVALAEQKPNILWITIEDWSTDLSCYGTKGLSTPHIDALAKQGIRYERAFTSSPVCSTSRSAMMTGYHQNFIGAHQHRTPDKKPLPKGIRPIPHLLKDAGYYTCLMSWKVDVNFLPDKKQDLFEGVDWKNRAEGQPFFARITFNDTHRSWNRDPVKPIAPYDVEIPPYYADTPFIRRDWANGFEQMQLVDRQVGKLLQRLEDEGLAENTLVIFIADHGRCHIRGKQFLYDGGIHIPMILRWPGKIEAGQVDPELTSSLDICATVLDVAGVKPVIPLHGQSLLDETHHHDYIFSARDKMDVTHDAMRCIRSKDYKLIVNLMPERPWCQLSRYKEGAYPALSEMMVLRAEGKLTPVQAAFLAEKKPEIELYEISKDPHEIKNLADDPAHKEIKDKLMAELDQWRETVIQDKGVTDEFRGKGAYPAEPPTDFVGKFTFENHTDYDFAKFGLPGWYPTRSLEEWRKARDLWLPYLFRAPETQFKRPIISYTQKAPRK